jgi:ribonuclease HIII
MPDDSKPSSFVTEIDPALANRLIADLTAQDFEISKPPYTLFAAKKRGVSCTLYTSGKLVVQGKEMGSFIEFYLEPQVLGKFNFTYDTLDLDTTARIGIDESGKGDYFGPLCIAGVYAHGEQIAQLKQMGVKDSKTLSDAAIRKIAGKIRSTCTCHIVRINPAKYNELYSKFGNLNTMLAWGHATAIEQLVEETGCKRVIIDQFADERVVLTALRRKSMKLDLTQRTKAEADLVVAAASILARDAFLYGMEKLEKTYELVLPKGASAQTVSAAKKLVEKHGPATLGQVAKLHFKTTQVVLGTHI